MPITSSQTPAGRARRALALGILVMFCPVLARGQGTSGEAAAPAFGTGTRRVAELLNFANGLFRDRRYAMAAEEYERFLKAAPPGPDAIEARFGLANARLFQGQSELARHQFEEFLKAAPDHRNAPTAWFRIGETAYMLGDLPAARQALETFIGRVGTTAQPVPRDRVALSGRRLPPDEEPARGPAGVREGAGGVSRGAAG